MSYWLTKKFVACFLFAFLLLLSFRFRFLFFTVARFSPCQLTYSFSHRRHKLFMLFFEGNSSPLFLSLPLALSLSAQTSKFSRKKTWLCFCFFSLKVLVAVQVVNVTSNIGLHVGVDGRMTDGNVITKISRIYRLPFFLTHGAQLGARAPL